jgi:hypothetical protein
MREEIHAIRADLEETTRQQMENVMTCINLEKQNLHKELTEKIEKAYVELQAVEVSLDTQTKKLQENLEVISTDLTMVDIEVKTTRKRCRDRRLLAAGRRQKKQEQNLDAGRRGKRRNLVAARRGTTSRV